MLINLKNILTKSERLSLEKNLVAFTMAEILLIIFVIGIVAMLTILVIIPQIQMIGYKSAWKKTYSDLNQAVKLIVQDHGNSLENVSTSIMLELSDSFKGKFKIIKSCNKSVDEGCWHDDSNIYYLTNGLAGNYFSNKANSYGFILSNGTLLALFNYDSPDCTNHSYGNNSVCTMLLIDTNGFKKPNTFGKDIFLTEITKDSILPVGNANDGYTYKHSSDGKIGNCNPPDSNSTGIGCAARYLYY